MSDSWLSACRYVQVMHDDPVLVRKTKGGKDTKILTDAQMQGVFKRLTARMAQVQASESCLTVTASYAKTFEKKFITRTDQGSKKAMMTGERCKVLMNILMFTLRDLATPEIRYRARYRIRYLVQRHV